MMTKRCWLYNWTSNGYNSSRYPSCCFWIILLFSSFRFRVCFTAISLSLLIPFVG